MPLSLALYHAENYTDPYVREDLQQLIASLQAQLGQPAVAATRSILIPNVQRGTLTIPDGTPSATVTLPTPIVDHTRTQVAMLGFSSNDPSYTSHRRNFPRLKLDTGASTLTGNLGDNATGDLIISWEVTEWTVTPEAGSI